MTGPTLATAPTAADIEAIADPFQRVITITAVSRTCGTLPPPLARLRRDALLQLRATHSAGTIAYRVGLTRTRIFEITRAVPGETIDAPTDEADREYGHGFVAEEGAR